MVTSVNCPNKECIHNSGKGTCQREEITLSLTDGVTPGDIQCDDEEYAEEDDAQ